MAVGRGVNAVIETLTIVLALLGPQMPQQAEAPPARPLRIARLDEAAKDESFLVFRNQLLEAIDHQSIKDVLNVVSADVQVTLTMRKGIPALRRLWHLDTDPKPFMRELRGSAPSRWPVCRLLVHRTLRVDGVPRVSVPAGLLRRYSRSGSGTRLTRQHLRASRDPA
jgi:hypothetical protein